MSPAAKQFLDEVRAIDGELAELIGGELERGVNLYAMIDMLRKQLEAKKAMDRLTPPTPKGR